MRSSGTSQPSLIARLAELANVAYVKESTLEVTRVRDIVRLAGDRLRVFGGVLGYESFLDGAVGWTAVGCNLMPREFSDMYRLCVERQDVRAASELRRDARPGRSHRALVRFLLQFMTAIYFSASQG